MAELLLQDYERLARGTDRASFVRRMNGPVLVVAAPAASRPSSKRFQGKSTRVSGARDAEISARLARLHNRARVLELDVAERLRVGRADDNELLLADETVSAHHALIHASADRSTYAIEDLGSTNGTAVNDVPIFGGEQASLHDGDLLAFGDAVFMFFTPGGLHDVLALMSPG